MTSKRNSSLGSFSTNASWTLGAELATDVADIGQGAGKRSPLVVEFYPPDGELWVGRFWGGSERGMTAVMPWPAPDLACVAVGGIAYLGPVRGPDDWQELPPEPTQGAIPFVSAGRIVLYDRWNAYCYDEHGPVWTAKDLALDGFSLEEVARDSFAIRIERDEDDVSILRIALSDGSRQER